MGMVRESRPIPKAVPVSFRCELYRSHSGDAEAKTVILAPIGLKFFPDRVVIGWACSWGASCTATGCRYAKARATD